MKKIITSNRRAVNNVTARGSRTLRRSFDKFQQYTQCMQKARRVIQRFQNSMHKRGLTGMMQRWRKTTHTLRFESAVEQLQQVAQQERNKAEANILTCERRIE